MQGRTGKGLGAKAKASWKSPRQQTRGQVHGAGCGPAHSPVSQPHWASQHAAAQMNPGPGRTPSRRPAPACLGRAFPWGHSLEAEHFSPPLHSPLLWGDTPLVHALGQPHIPAEVHLTISPSAGGCPPGHRDTSHHAVTSQTELFLFLTGHFYVSSILVPTGNSAQCLHFLTPQHSPWLGLPGVWVSLAWSHSSTDEPGLKPFLWLP